MPWCAIVIAAPLIMLPSSMEVLPGIFEFLSTASFWLGIPLMASLSLGNEFHYGTLSMLLSQPVDRTRVWSDKIVVLMAAVVSTGLLYLISWREMPGEFVAAGAIWMVVTVGSATFWTLIARSTIGGLVLNVVQLFPLIGLFILVNWMVRPLHPAADLDAVDVFLAVFALIYGCLMFWLGRRKLAAFQATGGFAGGDLLMTSPGVMGGLLGQVLRCRPKGLVLNLIRKELRLLWPVWMLMILCVVGLIILYPARNMQWQDNEWINGPFLAVCLVGIYALLTWILAGALSVGEDRAAGTLSWHMTLPVSAGLQWTIKLIVVLATTLVGLLLVGTTGALIYGKPFTDYLGEPLTRGRLLQSLLAFLSFPAFWCASATKGTMRAALWAIPAAYVVVVAYIIGVVLAMQLANTRIIDAAAAAVHSFTITYGTYDLIDDLAESWPLILVAIALVQSRRLFRREVQESSFELLRRLSWPVSAAFLLGFMPQLPLSFAEHNWRAGRMLVSEIHGRTAVLGLTPENIGTLSNPRQLSPEETEKIVLSEPAKLWLKDARIVVYGGTSNVLNKRNLEPQPTRWTRVHLANGWVCNAGGTFLNGQPRTGPAWCADPTNRYFVMNNSWLRSLLGFNPWRPRW